MSLGFNQRSDTTQFVVLKSSEHIPNWIFKEAVGWEAVVKQRAVIVRIKTWWLIRPKGREEDHTLPRHLPVGNRQNGELGC